MHPYLRTLWLTPLAVLLIGAAAAADPEEYIRQGNAAFEREEWDAALKFYGLAEERTPNPGLVAANKGAALYRSGDYPGAAAHYRRCLEDATGPRRAAFLYDLGTATLMQSKGAEPKLIRQAIDCFALCLRQPEAADDVRKNAAHNLELAKVLYAKARQARAGKDPGSNDPDEPKDNKPPEPKKEETKPQSGDPTVGPNGEPMPKGKPEAVDPRDPTQPIPVDAPPPPGTGDLPPVPDSEDLKRMQPEEAARHVQRAAELILRERRKNQTEMAPKASKIIADW